MISEEFLENFGVVSEVPGGMSKLRDMVLQLAVRGRLVAQDPKEGDASSLARQIEAERAKLKPAMGKSAPPLQWPYALPSTWVWLTVERVFHPLSTTGKKTQLKEIKTSGRFPVIDQGQVFVRGYTDNEDALIHLPGPVIVFGDHTREVKYVDFDFVAGADGTKILRPIQLDERYFYWFLRSLRLPDRGYGRHYKLLVEQAIPIPPLPEQKRIVAKVDQLMALCDELEARQNRKQQAGARLTRAALDALTSAEGPGEFAEAWRRVVDHFDVLFATPEDVGALRRTILGLSVRGVLVRQLPQEEAADILLARLNTRPTPIDATECPFPLPEGWQWARFTEVATLESCLVEPADFRDWPHIAPDNIEKATGKLLAYRTIGDDGVTSAKHRFEAGRLLYSKIRPNLSKVVVVDFEGLCSADMYPIASKIERDYLHLYMLSDVFLGQVVKSDNRLAMPKVNQQQLSLTVVPVPPLAEQRRIVAKVAHLVALCDTLESKLREAARGAQRLAQAMTAALVA